MDTFQIIGVDGGATKVSAWDVHYNNTSKSFTLGEINHEVQYNSIPGYVSDFKPIDIPVQLAEREKSPIPVTTEEQQQEATYVEACAVAIEKITMETGVKSVLIGLGMPGLKTEDKRGIAVVANGPRMLNYSSLLEERLKAAGISLAGPIRQLGSDADYCGIGENATAEGAFKTSKNAYYLGGGTGVADALKLNDKVIAMDAVKEWMAKTWEMQNGDAISLERYCSAGGIQSLYATAINSTVEALNEQAIYPPQIAERALAGEAEAIKTMEKLSDTLAKLLYSRINTLFAGWQEEFAFMNPNKPKLESSHPFTGSYFDAIIIGQRLGMLYAESKTASVFKQPVLKRLNELIAQSTTLDEKAKAHYADLESIIHVSTLRAAPALGAGVEAFLTYKEN